MPLPLSQRGYVCTLLIVLLGGIIGCRTAPPPVPADAVVLSGRINPMMGPSGAVLCWVLESGSDLRSLKYYVLVGREELMERLRQEDATVTLRAIIRSDISTDCPVGTVAEVYEIISLRTPKD
ncbi:MAG: hypothetical protein RML15_08800 [Bacteroidota bacterium]|nr:hypothetical protein [Candidatus Kapabacteria bacterium]MDW8075743.1 hypothetical protein [Bacteroidota bacterium]MDW8272489.1 hypothetical protein [Bacteroidota bacterium]